MPRDSPADWSNAKKARIFAHIIGHLALKFGDHGVLKIPLSTFEADMTVGFDREGEDLLIVVDVDPHETERNLGRVAYEAFKAHDDDRHPGDDPLMDWEYVPEETKAGWERAARAVWEALSA